METANVYGDLAADGIQRGLVGLRVGGLVRCEKKKLERRKRWKRKEKQRRVVCTQNQQMTWTDEGRENPKKEKCKGVKQQERMDEGRDELKEKRKSMEGRNGGGNCLTDMNG